MAECYVGRKPCGCIGFVTMDLPDMRRENAREIAECIRIGWTVERTTAEKVRTDPLFFPKKCPHVEEAMETPPLFEGSEHG